MEMNLNCVGVKCGEIRIVFENLSMTDDIDFWMTEVEPLGELSVSDNKYFSHK